MQKIKIGIINQTINMLDFLFGKENGIYQSNGLAVDFDLVAGNESIELLLDGKLDFVVSVGAAVRAIMANNAPLRATLLVHQNAPHWLMASSSIDSPENLRGKKVQAAQPGSEPDVMVQKYLSENGLNPQIDVNLIYERSHPGWTFNGSRPQEDAVIARTLEQEVLEEWGYHTLVELCEHYPNTLIHGLITTEKYLNNNAAIVDAMISSHTIISEWINDGRNEVIDFISKTFQVSEARAHRAITSLKGKFVARLDPEDFQPVINASATTLGIPAISTERLLNTIK